ncbi:lysosomal thioesterase PPT2-B-like [Saccostrea echinata]|uniref:lysosomal thioesterase PPT2-B-like n=1 Tax=Saccostrea echinata TaxID=191078 RepID=UPI002A82E3DD|nr:lysosomal thioesterase PPT2-B-like [Saccostrea echinata]
MLFPRFTLFFFSMVSAYKPVVLVHGVFGTADGEFSQTFDKWIPDEHSGTIVYPIRLYEKFCSLTPMWIQIAKIRRKVADIMVNHSDGIHFVCFSQGGLLCRGVLSSMNHNVDTFISLSSPQAGQYGIPDPWKKYIDSLKQKAYRLLYSKFFQGKLSIANYWNDPHHQDLFRKYSVFLAPLDGTTPTANLTEYRRNFLKLRKLVLIGGPKDDVIRPWQSSHFGFYDDKESVVEMKKQQFFMKDDFGLKTLYTKGRVTTFTFPGIRHSQWYTNRTVFNKAILPFLT